MILILLCILTGVLIVDLLCSPTNNYPIFIIIFALLPIIIYSTRQIIAKYSRTYYIAAIIMLIISYLATSYLIFHIPSKTPTDYSRMPGNKSAVIFFSPGEMSHYSPFLASGYLLQKSYFSKPYFCFKIKVKMHNAPTINSNLINIAYAVQNSILNYKPYIFYIGLFNNGQRLNKMIDIAYKDGCNKIYIINYSNSSTILSKSNLPPSKDISIKITPPLLATTKGNFSDTTMDIINAFKEIIK